MRSGSFPLRISAPLTSLALTGLLLLGGCADGAGPAGDLGIEGASCVRSPDCASPLQCLGGVCTDPEADPGPTPGAGLFEGSDDDDQPGSIADAFVAADVTPDVPHVTEILEWADLAEHDVFPDGTHSTQPFDTSQTEIFSDCEVLGIADEWVGTFLGEIAFDLDTGGLVYPETGTISVVGELSFDITCIDSKLVVVGLMSGSGAVVGRTEQGDFPFEVAIQGFYSPTTETLDAQLVDGVVLIYGLLEVYFEGDFDGDLTSEGRFDGDWAGEAVGTNVDDVITGTAFGAGSWLALGG